MFRTVTISFCWRLDTTLTNAISSLRHLCVLCVSAVILQHLHLPPRPENAEVAQRRVVVKETYAGLSFYWTNNSFLSDRARVCARVRKTAIGAVMNLETVASLVVFALLLIYLTYALLRPEKF